MADNYLEKHYEDYLKKKAAWEKARKLGIIRKKKNTDNNNSNSQTKE